MKKHLIFFLALVFLACSDNGENPENLAGGLDTLLIVHTNDHHGAIFPSNGLGGLSRRASFIETLKNRYKNTLILDAGDINTGSVLSNVFKAEPDILAYNFIGYHAVVLGNHEFNSTLEVLQKQMEIADFKFVSANAKTPDGQYVAAPYIIKNFGNIRVAVIGITTSNTAITAAFGRNFVFEDEIGSARRAVQNVKENVNLIVLLTHVGIDDLRTLVGSTTLADSVAGINLIIDGHSHTRLAAPLFVNNVPIVSAFEWGKEVGQARFIFENGKIKSFDWQKTEIDDAIPENLALNEIIRPFADSLQRSMGDTIAESSAAFPFTDDEGNRLPRMGESAIGNLICDALMARFGDQADIALINGGEIRAGLPQGKITKEDIFRMLPFESFVKIVELSGAQIVELFDFVATIPQGNGGFAQVSKEVRYELDLSTKTISNLTINGEEIDLQRRYFVITNEFLVSGGDGYTVFAQNHGVYTTSRPISDIMIEYLENLTEPIAPILDGRIRR